MTDAKYICEDGIQKLFKGILNTVITSLPIDPRSTAIRNNIRKQFFMNNSYNLYVAVPHRRSEALCLSWEEAFGAISYISMGWKLMALGSVTLFSTYLTNNF